MLKFPFFNLFIFLLIVPTLSIAQDQPELIDAEPIPSNRYRKVSGAPYLFEEFKVGTIYGKNLTIFKDQLFNYNGETQRIEVKVGDELLELMPGSYLRAEVISDNMDQSGRPEKIILQRGVHKKFEDSFVRIVYRGRRLILIEHFKSIVDKTAAKHIGETGNLKFMLNDKSYYLKHHNEVKPFKRDEKAISKLLGHESEMTEYLEENNLDLSKESDLSRLLKWYENKGYVK